MINNMEKIYISRKVKDEDEQEFFCYDGFTPIICRSKIESIYSFKASFDINLSKETYKDAKKYFENIIKDKERRQVEIDDFYKRLKDELNPPDFKTKSELWLGSLFSDLPYMKELRKFKYLTDKL
jgi:hypothetical protein